MAAHSFKFLLYNIIFALSSTYFSTNTLVVPMPHVVMENHNVGVLDSLIGHYIQSQ